MDLDRLHSSFNNYGKAVGKTYSQLVVLIQTGEFNPSSIAVFCCSNFFFPEIKRAIKGIIKDLEFVVKIETFNSIILGNDYKILLVDRSKLHQLRGLSICYRDIDHSYISTFTSEQLHEWNENNDRLIDLSGKFFKQQPRIESDYGEFEEQEE